MGPGSAFQLDHVTISRRCIVATHMATGVATPLRRLYPGSAEPVCIRDGAICCPA